jgi:hypothetical protein
MNRILSFSFLLFILGIQHIWAQNELDALRYSQTTISGTARSMGLGGGASAMGADLSAATLNPAGLGLYRRSDLVFTPSLRFINTEGQLLGTSDQARRGNFGFANLGVAFHTPVMTGYGENARQADRGIRSYVIAIGFNQLENYYRSTDVQGYNPSSSITDFFAEQATGTRFQDLNPFSYAGLAWDAYAIDVLEGPNGIIPDQFFGAGTGGDLAQRVRIEEEGRRNEWFISAAANLDDFLFFGGTLGIQDVRYNQTFLYDEEDVNDSHSLYVFDPNNPNGFPLEFPFNSLQLRETLESRGMGINAKLGVLVKPVNRLRVGLSIHSPTYIAFDEQFSNELGHNHNLDVNNLVVASRDTVTTASSGTSESQFNLTTPFRLNVGAMYLLGKRGFVTADLEYLDYGSTRLQSGYILGDPLYYDYEAENERIQDLYPGAINLRLGAELREGIYRLRAGAAFYGSTLVESARIYEDINNPGTALSINPNRRVFTFGAGIRQLNYYVDVAYVNQSATEKLSPYTTSDPELFDPTLVSRINKGSLVFSVGFLIN